MQEFIFDVVLDAADICNLDKERQLLIDLTLQGRRAVIYGRRNTGKTSLVQSVCMPAFSTQAKGVSVFVDFMGVNDLDDISHRLAKALERTVTQALPIKSMAKSLLEVFKSLRPTMEIDPITGELSFSLAIKDTHKRHSLETLLERISAMHKIRPVFLVFDEFQDITAIKGAAALLRGALQNLPANLPIFMLGSKKHLLAQLFGPHAAPFAGWGRDVEIPAVTSPEYMQAYYAYVAKRFGYAKLKISFDVLKTLIDAVQGIPEAINIVCDYIMRHHKATELSEQDILLALNETVRERVGRFAERLAILPTSEQQVMIALAKYGPLKKPKGKELLRHLPDLSPSTVFNIVKRLEDRAEIYRSESGFSVADPLLRIFLLRYR